MGKSSPNSGENLSFVHVVAALYDSGQDVLVVKGMAGRHRCVARGVGK